MTIGGYLAARVLFITVRLLGNFLPEVIFRKVGAGFL